MRHRSYILEWTRQAAGDFKKIKDARLRSLIITVLEEEIASDPLIGKPLNAPFKGVRSYRVGKLRILYKPYKDRLVIVVLKIDHRRSVYRKY